MATGDHLTELLAAADAEFAEAGFRTADFARVRELLAEALAGAEQAGDLAGRARSAGRTPGSLPQGSGGTAAAR
jgi:hypothetical protein